MIWHACMHAWGGKGQVGAVQRQVQPLWWAGAIILYVYIYIISRKWHIHGHIMAVLASMGGWMCVFVENNLRLFQGIAKPLEELGNSNTKLIKLQSESVAIVPTRWAWTQFAFMHARIGFCLCHQCIYTPGGQGDERWVVEGFHPSDKGGLRNEFISGPCQVEPSA